MRDSVLLSRHQLLFLERVVVDKDDEDDDWPLRDLVRSVVRAICAIAELRLLPMSSIKRERTTLGSLRALLVIEAKSVIMIALGRERARVFNALFEKISISFFLLEQ